MNRVDQVYEDETAIRMVLIGDNDKLNLNTAADMTGPDGPCGAAACFTAGQAGTCAGAHADPQPVVIGQLVGASNYDIGHIALGNTGGGVAQLGVVGGNNKARGCTGLTTPVGDFFAVDYVAHEMGHQFAGNHTFNGTQLNCAGGNRNAGTSVEPGSGSSIMAYAGICQQDNLQPHSDPYWSQRSYDEITAYTSSDRAPINEVQTVSLSDFDGTDSFTISWDGKTSAPDHARHELHDPRGIQREIQGASEVQTVTLAGNEARRLAPARLQRQRDRPDRQGPELHAGRDRERPRGRQRAAAGRADRLHRRHTVVPDPDRRQHAAVLGAGGLAITNGNVAAAVNAIPGFAGTVRPPAPGNTGFTLQFAGASREHRRPGDLDRQLHRHVRRHGARDRQGRRRARRAGRPAAPSP